MIDITPLDGPTHDALEAVGRLLAHAEFESHSVSFDPGPGKWTVQVGAHIVADSDIGRAADRALGLLRGMAPSSTREVV